MIQRELYMKQIRPFIGTDLVKAITGIRRSGKSTLLSLIQEELLATGVDPEQIIAINFENLAYAHLQNALALHDEIIHRTAQREGKVYLFFDEIQEVKDWEKCINSLRVGLDCDIYLTGSNAKLLSGELSTYLAGRYVEFVIYPFSFAEFLDLYRPLAPEATLAQCFQKYLVSGGMPYLDHLRYEEAPSKLYLKYSCAAFLFYQVRREDLQGKQVLASNEKYYLADHGIREAVYGGNMRDINLILENIVYLELLRRQYKVTVGKLVTKENDFVGEKQGEKLYVQVAYILASDESIQREFAPTKVSETTTPNMSFPSTNST